MIETRINVVDIDTDRDAVVACDAGGTSDAGTLERVSGAVSDVVQAEMERPSTEPSYATHLATALGPRTAALVAMETPFSVSTDTSGMMPAALE